ncbi:flagellar basal-body rod protein FlgF [Tepidanaerobacter syntrophicus]|uniref:flagellar basal-body rod protein FlgF n=1 Tax=Tepidanaerobacter syntrophicus TaxID=224999 RepID=UPI001BD3F7B8|nr:flagellar basal-body rod protein FlgF [Tepidanaerobacter syntrophicus]
MIRGLYTGASGMISEMNKTDVISNNLANASTTGFKKDRAVFKAFPEMDIHRINDPIRSGINRLVDPRPFIGSMGTGAITDEVSTDFSQGPIKTTSNPLDIALSGEGFFSVQTPEGIRYTRDGSFTTDTNNFLITKEGYFVLGQNGPIELNGESDITINRRGEIFADGEIVDRLQIVDFQDKGSLEKQGDNLYMANAQDIASVAEVIQGALESSNVNTISEMVDLITTSRAYEASQKVITTHDELLGKAVNDIAAI